MILQVCNQNIIASIRFSKSSDNACCLIGSEFNKLGFRDFDLCYCSCFYIFGEKDISKRRFANFLCAFYVQIAPRN